jgi:hypothetical protein
MRKSRIESQVTFPYFVFRDHNSETNLFDVDCELILLTYFSSIHPNNFAFTLKCADQETVTKETYLQDKTPLSWVKSIDENEIEKIQAFEKKLNSDISKTCGESNLKLIYNKNKEWHPYENKYLNIEDYSPYDALTENLDVNEKIFERNNLNRQNDVSKCFFLHFSLGSRLDLALDEINFSEVQLYPFTNKFMALNLEFSEQVNEDDDNKINHRYSLKLFNIYPCKDESFKTWVQDVDREKNKPTRMREKLKLESPIKNIK